MRGTHRVGRLRNRAGATLVVVAILLMVLVGVAGMAIDFARMYAFRAQLQTTADASAQAGAVDLIKDMPLEVTETALAFRDSNLVNGVSADMDSIDVEGGTWDFTTLTFTKITDGMTTAGWDNPNLNAVRVRARYTGNTTLSRVFGRDLLGTQVQAIGAVGYVTTASCLHPWAVSYQTILDALFGKGVKTPAYDLEPDDIDSLSKMSYPQNKITLLSSTDDPITPGNIAQVKVNDPWSGNNYYRAAIEQDPDIFPPNGCPNIPVGPGTWLETDAGEGPGQTFNGLREFCEANGGLDPGANNNKYTCSAHPRVKLAMWDIHNGLSGANLQYRVKYVGVFAVVKFDRGQGANKVPQIEGYFTSMAGEGGMSGTPGPIQKIALVR
jgi:Flp pilus assembly protein TadG